MLIGIVFGSISLVIISVIFIISLAGPITTTPDNSDPDLKIDGQIDIEDRSIKFEVLQEEINLREYDVMIVIESNDTHVEAINLSCDRNRAQKGDIITYTNETWSPVLSQSYEIIIVHNVDHVVRYRETIKAE